MLNESQQIEYKESWHDDYLKWICGFANAQGGTMYIGVTDHKEVCGLRDAKKLMEDIPNKVRDILGVIVDVNLLTKDNMDYIAIRVPVSSVPLTYRGKYYYRTGSTLQELGGVALNDFILRKMNVTWDATIVPEATLNDLDSDAVNYFVKAAVYSKRLTESALHDDVEKILRNLDLINGDGQLTIAALLLFGKKIERWCLGAEFRIGRFGSSMSDLIMQDSVACPLILMPDRIISILKSKYLVSPIRYDGLIRMEPLEIPEEALREILCNSIVHRNMQGSHTQMRVMNNRITLWNDGTLPPTFTINTLLGEHESHPRNKLIAKAFYLAGFIESWGRGYDKIRKEFTKEGLEMPIFEEARGGVLATIKRERFLAMQEKNDEITPENDEINSKNDEITPENDEINSKNDEIKKRRQEILRLISEDSHISSKRLADQLSISLKTLQRDLNALQKDGCISLSGNTKAREWIVVRNNL